MEQESKSMEIQRYKVGTILGFDSGYPTSEPSLVKSDQGNAVLYADHAEAMKAAQDAIAVEKRALLAANAELAKYTERMRVMREALENVVEGNDIAYSRRSTMQGWPGSDFRRIAVAALASAAPEDRDLWKRKVPDSLLRSVDATIPDGCHCKPGKCMAPKIMGVQMPCRDPQKAANAPVAANMQPPTNDERLRMYESDEINGSGQKEGVMGGFVIDDRVPPGEIRIGNWNGPTMMRNISTDKPHGGSK